jgi:hypothetical protein
MQVAVRVVVSDGSYTAHWLAKPLVFRRPCRADDKSLTSIATLAVLISRRDRAPRARDSCVL